jgi:hypothetical protein
MNYQTVYEDLKLLFIRAIEEQEVFRSDMQALLGEDVLADAKVGVANRDGEACFNACAVRRVLVKWAGNLLERCPDLKKSKTLMRFITAKSIIVRSFYFKSTVRPTTHKKVIDFLAMLIEAAKYDFNTNKKRE